MNSQTNESVVTNKQLVIGLDFGVAFTKVIIGDNRVRYAVPFPEFAHPDNQYLLPSILSVDENQHCFLSDSATSSSDSQSLKLPLLDRTYTKDDLLRITAYLVLVFRASSSWLLDRYQKRYSRYHLSWSINAGLPMDVKGNPELTKLYSQLIQTAWNLSVLPGPVSLKRVNQFLDADDNVFSAFPARYRSKIIGEDRINTLSGIVAQVSGYVNSRQSRAGLHMLVDIGAGSFSIATFDIAPFDIDGSDPAKTRYTFYTCAVEQVGVCYLLKRRYENLKLADDEINLFKNIPDTHAFSLAHDLTDKDIKFADTLYSGDAAKLITRILDITRSEHDPDSDMWESGVQTITCGGGAHLEIIQNIRHTFENKAPAHKIQSLKPELPDDLMAENIPEDSFDRLSVAYGLSFVREEENTPDEKSVSDNKNTVEV